MYIQDLNSIFMQSEANMRRDTSGVNYGTRFMFDSFNNGGIIYFRYGLLEDGSNNDIDHIFLDISRVRVGINNTEPQYTLDVSGYALIDDILIQSGDNAGYIRPKRNKFALGVQSTNVMTIQNNAVCINKWDVSAGMALDVSGSVQISSSSGLRLTNTEVKSTANERIGYIDFYNGEGGGGAAIESCVNVSGPGGGVNNNSDLRFMTSFNYDISYVERMRIDRAGNVGIGTTNPSEALDVSGNIQIQQKYTESGIYPAGNLTFSTNDSGTQWELGVIEAYVKANGGNPWQYPGGLAFKTKNADNNSTTAATTKMVIDASGNVGIGTTNPRYELDVSGSITAQTVRIGEIGYGSTHGGIKFHNLAKKSFALLQTSGGQTFLNCALNQSINFQVNNTDRMVMDKSGNLGIGISSPKAGLQVKNDNGLTISATATSGSRTSTLRLGPAFNFNQDGYCAKITSTNDQSSYSSDLRFYTHDGSAVSSIATQYATERMCIDHNGNVGIGITNPAYTLDVSGDIDISGGMLTGATNDSVYFKINNKNYSPSGDADQIRLRNDGDVYITSTLSSTKLQRNSV